MTWIEAKDTALQFLAGGAVTLLIYEVHQMRDALKAVAENLGKIKTQVAEHAASTNERLSGIDGRLTRVEDKVL